MYPLYYFDTQGEDIVNQALSDMLDSEHEAELMTPDGRRRLWRLDDHNQLTRLKKFLRSKFPGRRFPSYIRRGPLRKLESFNFRDTRPSADLGERNEKILAKRRVK